MKMMEWQLINTEKIEYIDTFLSTSKVYIS